MTGQALGDVIDWPVIIKKNPPDKFLKRPPVRFLYDLFKFIHETLTKCNKPEKVFLSDVVTNDWDSVVGVDKHSKVNYMNEVSRTVFHEYCILSFLLIDN